MQIHRTIAIVIMVTSLSAVKTSGDEGMYLFNDLPTQLLQQRHGFEPSAQWADDLRLASVRFNVGGSGSFISSDGLVLTNHHVASDTLHKLSTPQRNLIDDGFLAASTDAELKAPDLELNQLVSIEDVTDQVDAAVDASASIAEATAQRRAVIAEIEKKSFDTTGFRSDVVTLFGGAKYHLYRYKKYTDVRLVWAPETAAAFFGGDADNFEYPRYCLDATIMRVYEDGKPAKLKNFLRWSDQAVSDGDLVFVSGNPGRTQRIFTVEALKYLRDARMPYVLDYLRRKEIMLQQFGLGGAEAERRARDELFGVQNGRKAYTGMIAGLQDPQIMATKVDKERSLIAALIQEPEYGDAVAAFEEISKVQAEKRELLGQSVAFRSRLFDLALTLVLRGIEDEKPNAQRLREFTEAGRQSLEQDLLSEAPIYRDLERVKLADEIARMVEHRGADSDWVQKVLGGKSPRNRASELIDASSLHEVAVRKQLLAASPGELNASQDALIRFALLLEPEYRRVRTIGEQLDERERQAYAKITEAISRLQGDSGYPDATFTLRLAFGLVKPYQQDGETVQVATNLGGAFEHESQHDGQKDFELPESWHQAKSKADLSTQLNFICTADIIGGNSGSPVVNRKGELVGLIFDGNIQSLTSDYLYSDEQARAVSVSGVGILEALRSIYGAKQLADSIGK